MLKVHPLISLLSFMVFATFVSLGQTVSSLIGFSILLMLWLISWTLPAPKAWMMIKRLRIFFLSIFIMYLWFTPGELIWPVLDDWSPTFDGLAQGIQRIAALIILVLGVESLLRMLDRDELLVGLYYLATPFQHLGVSRERFVVRVLLTLEAVKLQSPQEKYSKFKIRNINKYIATISQNLAEKFIVAANYSSDTDELEFEIKALPHWVEWTIPLLIAAMFVGINGFFSAGNSL